MTAKTVGVALPDMPAHPGVDLTVETRARDSWWQGVGWGGGGGGEGGAGQGGGDQQNMLGASSNSAFS